MSRWLDRCRRWRRTASCTSRKHLVILRNCSDDAAITTCITFCCIAICRVTICQYKTIRVFFLRASFTREPVWYAFHCTFRWPQQVSTADYYTNDNMKSLSSSEPKLDEQLISQIRGSSRSRENLAANLVQEMFSKEERLRCNVSGKCKKEIGCEEDDGNKGCSLQNVSNRTIRGTCRLVALCTHVRAIDSAS